MGNLCVKQHVVAVVCGGGISSWCTWCRTSFLGDGPSVLYLSVVYLGFDVFFTSKRTADSMSRICFAVLSEVFLK